MENHQKCLRSIVIVRAQEQHMIEGQFHFAACRFIG